MTHSNYKLHKNKTLDTENAFPSRGTSCRSRTLLHANTKRPNSNICTTSVKCESQASPNNPQGSIAFSIARGTSTPPCSSRLTGLREAGTSIHATWSPRQRRFENLTTCANQTLTPAWESAWSVWLISNCQNKWGWGYDFKGRVCSVMPCTIMGTGASRSRVSPGMARASLVARLSMRQRLRWSAGVSACYAK